MRIYAKSVEVWLWFKTGETAVIGEITEDKVESLIESYGDSLSDHLVSKNYGMELTA